MIVCNTLQQGGDLEINTVMRKQRHLQTKRYLRFLNITLNTDGTHTHTHTRARARARTYIYL